MDYPSLQSIISFIDSIQPPDHTPLRIVNIQLAQKNLRLTTPFETSFGKDVDELRIYPIITFSTADGQTIQGIGECTPENKAWYNGEYRSAVLDVLQSELIPALKSSAHDISSVSDFTSQYSWVVGHNIAKAGLEGAYWDAVGKLTHQPVWRLFGGTQQTITTGTSVGLSDEPRDIIDKVSMGIANGARRIKLKIKPHHDVEIIKAVRKEYPTIKLMVDANAAYDLFDKDDIHRLQQMDQFDLMMIEQPGHNDDIYFHSLLSRELKTPICLDESVHSMHDLLEAIELWKSHKILDRLILNIKPPRIGGFWEGVRMAKVCHFTHIPAWCGGMLESAIGKTANTHLCAVEGFSLPGDHTSQKPYYKEDVAESPKFQDGEHHLSPDTFGWGIPDSTVESLLKESLLRS